jgi:hypothetical protein
VRLRVQKLRDLQLERHGVADSALLGSRTRYPLKTLILLAFLNRDYPLKLTNP